MVPGSAFTPASYTSVPVLDILPGPARVTVLVNGVPSLSNYIHLAYGTTISISTSQTPAAYGTTVIFTAAVISSAGTPAGTVQFRVDGVDFGPPVPLVGGAVGVGVASLSPGLHQVTAVYTGDLNFAEAVTAAPLLQEIVTPRLYLPLILQ